MAFREFTDSDGVAWTVWDVRPGSTQLLVAAADYSSEYYHTGWLSFQTRWGTDHRRLSPIPPSWESATEATLRKLLKRATPTRAARDAPESKADRDVTQSPVVRAFLYPGGRAWTVCVANPDFGGPPVLRFTSGGRSVDLAEWPLNWADLSDESLAALLRRVPRTGPQPGPRTPRRRWNDPRA
jgi:hypothetical protein